MFVCFLLFLFSRAHARQLFLAEIKMPSGKIDLPVIEDNRDGTIRIQYDPKEDGVHELVLLYNGAPVTGKYAQSAV